MPALFTRMSSRRSPPLLERIARPLQLCGTRHGLRCRPRVTASAQARRPNGADQGPFVTGVPLGSSSGRTLTLSPPAIRRTGRPDPSSAAIAAKAGVCVRTVATALQRLRELEILNWVRRCAERWADGRFMLEQETNAYGLLPESQWRGYRPPPEPPAAPCPYDTAS